METLDTNAIARLRHWMGERLSSRDLRDQAGYEASLRWWHNRALHEAFGVAQGLSCTLGPGPDAGDGVLQAVRVSSGLAYDGYGRELRLAAERSVELPPPEYEPRVWVLAVHLAPGSLGEPGFAWRERGAAHPCEDVLLALGLYRDGEFFLSEHASRKLHFSRSPVRPFSRPSMGTGSTVPGKTDWKVWSEELSLRAVAAGIEVRIDTTAAGFTDTPCYFAWLQGSPWSLSTQSGSHVSAPLPLSRVTSGSPTSFLFKIWFPGMGSGTHVESISVVTAASNPVTFARRELHVCWLGIQPHESMNGDDDGTA